MAETSEAKPSPSAPGGDAGGEEEKRDERMLECNICLDTARDAVVSMCGHLFWYVLDLSYFIFIKLQILCCLLQYLKFYIKINFTL